MKHKYKVRVRMPSKLDPHRTTIENWLTTEPQITALAIVRRLAAIDPAFSDAQHSIVQRLLRTLRKRSAHRVIADTAVKGSTVAAGADEPAFGRSPHSASPPPAPFCQTSGPLRLRPGSIPS